MPRGGVRSDSHVAAEKPPRLPNADYFIDSINPDDPSSIVAAMRFLIEMSANLSDHGNQAESIKCAESVLLLRRAHENAVAPLIGPLVEEGLLPLCSVDHAADIVLRCNSNAVSAFNQRCFDMAELFLGKALFLTDSRTTEELNYFPSAEARRLRLRAATLNNLGCMEKRRGRLEESLRYLRQAVDMEVALDRTTGGSPSTYLNMCTVLNELQRHDEAVIAVENALSAMNEQMLRQQHKQQLPTCAMMLVVGLYNLGVSLELRNRSGDVERAKNVYQQALEASRKYFVDPACPTVEMAMMAIQRMHADPVFREERLEKEKKERGKAAKGPLPPISKAASADHFSSATEPPPQQQQAAQETATSVMSVIPSTPTRISSASKASILTPPLSSATRPQMPRNMLPDHESTNRKGPPERSVAPDMQREPQGGSEEESPGPQDPQWSSTPGGRPSFPRTQASACSPPSPQFTLYRPETRLEASVQEEQPPPVIEIEPESTQLSAPVPLQLLPQQRQSEEACLNPLEDAKAAPCSESSSAKSAAALVAKPGVPGLMKVNTQVTEWRSGVVRGQSPKSLSDELRAQTVPEVTKKAPSMGWSGSSLFSRLESMSVKSGPSSQDPFVCSTTAKQAASGPLGATKRSGIRPLVLSPIRSQSLKSGSTASAGVSDGQHRIALSSVFESKDARKLSKGSSSSRLDTMSLFGRRRFASITSLAPKDSSETASTSRPILSAQQAASVEKHLMRAQLGQKKAEELRGSLSAAGRSAALARAKEREQKRLAKEEAKNDVALAGVLYEKFVEGMRTDELRRCHRAAVAIQRIWRGSLARTLLTRMVIASKKIQKTFRIYLVKLQAIRLAEKVMEERRQSARLKKEMENAIIIQNRVRQFLRRLEIRRCYLARKMRHRNAACRIQRGFRAFLRWREEHLAALIEAQRAEEERIYEMEVRAARRIQVAYRCYLKRKMEFLFEQEQERRKHAAEVIQARMRGVLARAWFRYYKAYHYEQELKSATNQKRIVVMQTATRALLSSRLRRRMEMDLLYQLQQQILNKYATKIQCQWRNRLARIKLDRLRAEKAVLERRVTRVKRWYQTRVLRRSFLQVRENRRQNDAATCIAQWYRMCKVREKERETARYHAIKAREARLARLQADSVVLLQASWRAHNSFVYVRSVRSSFLRLTLCAEFFQRIARGFQGRMELFAYKCFLIRQAQERVEAQRRARAACVVQRAWRCAFAKDRVVHMRRCHVAATMISKHYRARLCRMELQRLREAKRFEEETAAAMRIQKAARHFLRRLDLLRHENRKRKRKERMFILMRRDEAATTLQAIWRGRVTRRVLEEERRELAALEVHIRKVQRAWRTHKFRCGINATVLKHTDLRKRRSTAALKIQCFWRKMVAAEKVAVLRQLHRRRVKNARIIQRWWRCMLAKMELEARRLKRQEEVAYQLYYMERWDEAVSLINAFLQTMLSQQHRLVVKRKRLLEQLTDKERERYLRRHAAIIKIQRFYRGHYERMYARGVRRKKMEEEQRKREQEALEQRSALAIQCAYRVFRACCEVTARRRAKREKQLAEELEHYTTMDPQDVVRNLFWMHESHMKRDHIRGRLNVKARSDKAAVVIQRVVRRWLAELRMARRREKSKALRAVAIIKSYWKKYLECRRANLLEIQRRAATIIQAQFRGYIHRCEWEERRQASEKEKRQQVLGENKFDATATVLQSSWRRITAQRLVNRMREERMEEKNFHVTNEAARTIQQVYRCYRERRMNQNQ